MMKPPLLGALLLMALVAGAQAGTGHIYVDVRCQHNLFSQEMILTSFTANEAVSVYLTPDGKFDAELPPGDYVLILLDGNAGHREYRFFTVRSGEITHIDQFIGHAISGGGRKGRCGDVRVCTGGVCRIVRMCPYDSR
jgi:hypothetical protein